MNEKKLKIAISAFVKNKRANAAYTTMWLFCDRFLVEYTTAFFDR